MTRRYGARVAIDDLSLVVEPGACLALVGPSGCGKTTTLRLINRLLERSSGRVTIDGADVTAESGPVLRRRIGYVVQRGGLFPHLTVAENVGVTLDLLGWDAGRIAARVDAMLDLVELDPATVRGRWPSELSGGQQQRVGVARALAAEPPVVLLDEPFGALDPLTRERLQAAFGRIRRAIGFTAIFVTHDMVEAAIVADAIAVLEAGRLIQVGTWEALTDHPAAPIVRELVATPRRQLDSLARVLGGGPRP